MKVTVKHYIDTRLKTKGRSKNKFLLKADDGYYYPLYVQVVCKRQNTKLKSHIKSSFRDEDFTVNSLKSSIDDNQNVKLRKLILDEKKNIQLAISLMKPEGNDRFSLAGFNLFYEKVMVPVKLLFAQNSKHELKLLLKKSTIKELVEIINWELDYNSIRKGLDDILFRNKKIKQSFINEIKALDNAFSLLNNYVANKKMPLAAWVADHHEVKIKEYVDQNPIKSQKKILSNIQKITKMSL